MARLGEHYRPQPPKRDRLPNTPEGYEMDDGRDDGDTTRKRTYFYGWNTDPYSLALVPTVSCNQEGVLHCSDYDTLRATSIAHARRLVAERVASQDAEEAHAQVAEVAQLAEMRERESLADSIAVGHLDDPLIREWLEAHPDATAEEVMDTGSEWLLPEGVTLDMVAQAMRTMV